MRNAGKYAFGLLALVSLVAGVIVLMEELTGKDKGHYVLPCGLIGIGLIIGFFVLFASPDSDDSLACSLARDSDETDETSPPDDGDKE